VLEQDAGVHFDPEILETFKSIKDKIISIKEYWDEKEKNL